MKHFDPNRGGPAPGFTATTCQPGDKIEVAMQFFSTSSTRSKRNAVLARHRARAAVTR